MTGSSWLRRLRRPAVLLALAALITERAVERVLSGEPSISPGMQMTLALAPLVPPLLFMFALLQMFMHVDELRKRITLESVFIAFICALTLVITFAALERAGVYRPPWAQVGPAMMMLWAVAYVYSSWKYR